MRNARGRWRTARAVVRDWEDIVRAREVWDTSTAQDLARSGGEREHETGPRSAVAMRRVWARKPCRWRLEFEGPDGTNVFVGDLAWTEPPEAPREESMTTPDALHLEAIDATVAYIFDPWLVASELVMRVLGYTEHAGREAVTIVGVAEHGQGTVLGPYADDYELLVDAERGVLLRSACRFGGEEFKSTDVLEIAFDEDLSDDLFAADDTFRIEPQPGAQGPISKSDDR